LNDFNNASKESEKQAAAKTMQMHHLASLSVVLAAVSEFQPKKYAVAALPLFAVAATIHLTLLADGIKLGKKWGFPDSNIATLRAEFKKWTSPGTGATTTDEELSQQASSLKEAINTGTELGLPAKILDTWNTAYSDLFESGANSDGSVATLDYVSYAKKIYKQGRKEIKGAVNDGNPMFKPLSTKLVRAYAEYDTKMIMTVLNYAELWPYMTGEKITESAMRNLDREIFYGPYGVYFPVSDSSLSMKDWDRVEEYIVPWSPLSPAPVEKRRAPITAMTINAKEDVHLVRVKHGKSWDQDMGTDWAKYMRQQGYTSYVQSLDLQSDEYFKSLEVHAGRKIGKLEFKTNKGRVLANGSNQHGSSASDIAAPSGYELTSVKLCALGMYHNPVGLEGMYFGFRPLLTDSSQN
jgi:hypothetical protein